VFYAGAQFRALYGPRRDLVLLPAAYGIARLASIASGPPDPTFALISLTTVVQLLALIVVATSLRLFANATEQHAAIERALQRSDERYQLVARAMRDVVYDWNVANGTVEWTESMQTVFGFAPDAVGTTLAWWLDRVHPADRSALEASVADLLADSAIAVGSVRYRVRRADDSYAHVSGSVIVQRGHDGSVAHVIGSIRDITSEQQLEEQLRQSQKMEAVGQLAGGVAHDFNNLLTVIGGHVFMLVEYTPRTALTDKHLNGITHAVERAASLTRQLLAFSRKQILTPSLVNLNTVVDDVLQMMQPVIGEHVSIVTQLDRQLPPVFADSGQLGQVLVNLALNARDAMPDGGTLMIETECTTLDPRPDDAAAIPLPPGLYVRLTMRDTGVGMNPETLARAFEPFFTTKPHGKGSGLGLATVYGIVKQSSGDIQATSSPGAGAVFTILLPVVERPSQIPETRRPSFVADASQWPGRRVILLVEDDDGVREFTEQVLSRAGYVVRSACNGVDALRQVRALDGAIDAVVTDVIMPEMGGRELAQRLRAHQPELPVLFMTGYTDDSRMLRELHANGARLIEKPFTPRLLEIALQELMDVESSDLASMGDRNL
jgi:PAS domain S-box-containing protein